LVDPANDLVRGSNHEVFCLNGGLLVSDSERGTTGICPIDAQLISLGQPGLWRYTRDYTPRKPEVFVNLFNNVYSTNFAQWIEGSWSSRVRLWSVEANRSPDESLVTTSWEARTECLAATSHASAGSLPPTSCGLRLHSAGNRLSGGPETAVDAPSPTFPRGLLVTAFGPNPYGPGTMLRLWEQVGRAGQYTLRLPTAMKIQSAQPCNLRGQPLGPAKTLDANRLLHFAVEPMAPATFVLLGPSSIGE
jgi:alpha-mannosidase